MDLQTFKTSAKRVEELANGANQIVKAQQSFNNAQSGGQKAMALAQMLTMILG